MAHRKLFRGSQHDLRLAEIILRKIGAPKRDHADARAMRRQDAISRILDCDALRAAKAEPFKCQPVDIRRGLFSQNHVARRNHRKEAFPAAAEGGSQQGFDILKARRRCDRAGKRVFVEARDEPRDPWTERNRPRRDPRRIEPRLVLMQRQKLFLGQFRAFPAESGHERPNALLTAGDFQQIAIERLVPVPIEPESGKGCVERLAMERLGFAKRAIDVENDLPDRVGRRRPPEFRHHTPASERRIAAMFPA